MKKEKSVLVSFLALRPPTEFACSRLACENFRNSDVTIARKRAGCFFDEVSNCDVLLTFARTYFEQNSDKLI